MLGKAGFLYYSRVKALVLIIGLGFESREWMNSSCSALCKNIKMSICQGNSHSGQVLFANLLGCAGRRYSPVLARTRDALYLSIEIGPEVSKYIWVWEWSFMRRVLVTALYRHPEKKSQPNCVNKVVAFHLVCVKEETDNWMRKPLLTHNRTLDETPIGA